MYFINTTFLTLEEIHDISEIRYAILSHCWTDEEVTHEELASHKGGLRDISKAGVKKILNFCAKADGDHYDLGWIDTCCINKHSSAELTEAINSMYRWYAGASACYVYLSDVNDSSTGISHSRWFKRSWTLQELLAPSNVRFYDANWRFIGTKDLLKYEITRATTIDLGALEGADLSSYSVAQRMSWACDRLATRPEDIAYSLLGIFDVSMPMLYGEGGERAFIRLQEEITRYVTDETIFAWDTTEDDSGYSGIFAKSPAYFRSSQGMRVVREHEGRPFGMTNRGLSIDLVLIPRGLSLDIALLNCVHTQQAMPDLMVGFFVHRIGQNTYERVRSATTGDYRWLGNKQDLDLSNSSSRSVVLVARGNVQKSTFEPKEIPDFCFSFSKVTMDFLLEAKTRYVGTWNSNFGVLELPRDHVGTFLWADLAKSGRMIQKVQLGINADKNFCCLLYDAGHASCARTTVGREGQNINWLDIYPRGNKEYANSDDPEYKDLGWIWATQGTTVPLPFSTSFDGLWAVKCANEHETLCFMQPPSKYPWGPYKFRLNIVPPTSKASAWQVDLQTPVDPRLNDARRWGNRASTRDVVEPARDT